MTKIDDELQRQKRTNASLLDLLVRIQGGMPDPTGRIGPLIDEAQRTKQILDDCQDMIERKRLGP